MLVLLPPSETKRPGGSGVTDRTALAHSVQLGSARSAVSAALTTLSADADAAAAALKLGVKNRAESELNLVLDSGPVVPAIERYTGVLYDALGADSLDQGARDWLDRHVQVQSALFGLIGAGDLIPSYRLSAGTRLPGLTGSLKKVWRTAHDALDWSENDFVLDLRSKSYGDLAVVPNASFLHVAQRSGDGQVRALNHFNKAAKGDLVRRLAVSRSSIKSEQEFIDWCEHEGLELSVAANGEDSGGSADRDPQSKDLRHLTLISPLGVPATAVTR